MPAGAEEPVDYTAVRTLVVATTNRHKVDEIGQLLAGCRIDFGRWPTGRQSRRPRRPGETFEENARAKALYYAEATGALTVAEDSGLEIDALDGAPGVESARFGGAQTTYPEKFELIYDALRAATARRQHGAVCLRPGAGRGDRLFFETRGTVEGRIAPEPKGRGRLRVRPDLLLPAVRPDARRGEAQGSPPSATAAWRSARCARFSGTHWVVSMQSQTEVRQSSRQRRSWSMSHVLRSSPPP